MLVLIFLIGFTAAFVSSMSGCGSGLITLPSWLFLGFSLPAALVCDKINACVWTVFAARNYLRRQHIQWPFMLLMSALGILGAISAAYVVISVDEFILRRIIGAIILVVVVFLCFDKEFGLQQTKTRETNMAASLLGLPLGFYEAFFGAGNGIFASIALTKLNKFSLVIALGYYYAMAFIWSLFAAGVLVRSGHFELKLVVTASLGAGLGGYWGSRIGSAKGSVFVRKLFIALGVIFGVKLLLNF